jgi:DNA polymerase I-like protein with 3'-5' exonuclease and polymerase domains
LLLINNLLDFNECKPVLFIHDELLFEVRDEPAIKEKYYYCIKDAMEHPPLKSMFGFELTVPLVADAKVGYNLHEMEDYVP